MMTLKPDKYPQCCQCWHNTVIKNPFICENCENIDPEYNLEPPTNWEYEDPEGEWK